MATNHQQFRRSQHESIWRRRRVYGNRASSKEVGSDDQERPDVEARQFDIDFPTFTRTRGINIPSLDLFPPNIPGRPSPTPNPNAHDEDEDINDEGTSEVPSPTPTLIPSSSTQLTISSSSSIPTTPSSIPVVDTTSLTPSTTPVLVQQLTSSSRPAVTTSTSYVKASATNAAANGSSSNTTTSVGSNNPGPIIGGIVGAILGIAAIAFAITFWMRRKRQQEEHTFNASDFRRSAMLMPDPPTHGDIVAQGFGPPPSMTERRLPMIPTSDYASPAPFAVPAYNDHGYAPKSQTSSPGYGNEYNNGNYYNPGGQGGYNSEASPAGPNFAGRGTQASQGAQSWDVGQVINSATSPSPPNQYSTNPFRNPTPYTQSPFSPIQSPCLPQQIGSNSHDVTISGGQGEGEGPAVLATIGGAAVLTRGISQRSTSSGRSGPQLSISVPAILPTAVAVNSVSYPRLTRKPSREAKSQRETTESTIDPQRPPVPLPIIPDGVSTSSAEPTSEANGNRDSESSSPMNDYVDLARASVSPFQAAQYAEISKRLNADVPKGMPSPMVQEYVNASRDRELPPIPPPSPLAIASSNPRSASRAAILPPTNATGETRASMGDETSNEQRTSRTSLDSIQSIANARGADLSDFPIPPPSPAFTTSSKYRIDSTPPCLPEIAIESRVSVSSYAFEIPGFALHNNGSRISLTASSGDHHDTYNYHKSYTPYTPGGTNLGVNGLDTVHFSSSGDVGPAFPSGVTAGGSPFLMSRFPVTPSPLATSFIVPGIVGATENTPASLVKRESRGLRQEIAVGRTPEDDGAQASRSTIVVAEVDAGQKPTEVKTKERPSTVYSIYNPEDAYGGI